MKAILSILLTSLVLTLLSCGGPEPVEEMLTDTLPFEDQNPKILGPYGESLLVLVGSCIWEYNPQTKLSTEIHCPSGRMENLIYDDIRYFYYSVKDYGIYRLDLSDASISNLNRFNSCLFTDWIIALDVDDEGNVWCSPATGVYNVSKSFTVGNGLYKINWDTKECLQWDNSNSYIPHNTILSLEVREGQAYFSNVSLLWEAYDWEPEILIHFDGNEFTRLDSGNTFTPLLRNVHALSNREISYIKYQDKDILTDRYELFTWNNGSQSTNELLTTKLLYSAETYRDIQGNVYVFGSTKSVNTYRMLITEPYLIYNNAEIEFVGIKEINSLYRFGTKDSIWVGSDALYYVPIP